MKKKWMAKAFAGSHGQFKAKAEEAGMGTAEYARAMMKSKTASGHTKKQANLAMRGMEASKKKKKGK